MIVVIVVIVVVVELKFPKQLVQLRVLYISSKAGEGMTRFKIRGWLVVGLRYGLPYGGWLARSKIRGWLMVSGIVSRMVSVKVLKRH